MSQTDWKARMIEFTPDRKRKLRLRLKGITTEAELRKRFSHVKDRDVYAAIREEAGL